MKNKQKNTKKTSYEHAINEELFKEALLASQSLETTCCYSSREPVTQTWRGIVNNGSGEKYRERRHIRGEE